jgi:hypothetical protein
MIAETHTADVATTDGSNAHKQVGDDATSAGLIAANSRVDDGGGDAADTSPRTTLAAPDEHDTANTSPRTTVAAASTTSTTFDFDLSEGGSP